MKERLFRFKQFEVRHKASAMKVGVEAVILGAWADVSGVKSVLDAGTGCGVIALAIAQRCPEAKITGIDIDGPSIVEAASNFASSPWSGRLTALEADFGDWIGSAPRFDLIISNPPFFDSGITQPDSARLRARHTDVLSPASLLTLGADHLSDCGRIALVCPAHDKDSLTATARDAGLFPMRTLLVSGREGAGAKRIFAEFGLKECPCPVSGTLSIERSPGVHTSEYMALTRDFYLRF